MIKLNVFKQLILIYILYDYVENDAMNGRKLIFSNWRIESRYSKNFKHQKHWCKNDLDEENIWNLKQYNLLIQKTYQKNVK